MSDFESGELNAHLDMYADEDGAQAVDSYLDRFTPELRRAAFDEYIDGLTVEERNRVLQRIIETGSPSPQDPDWVIAMTSKKCVEEIERVGMLVLSQFEAASTTIKRDFSVSLETPVDSDALDQIHDEIRSLNNRLAQAGNEDLDVMLAPAAKLAQELMQSANGLLVGLEAIRSATISSIEQVALRAERTMRDAMARPGKATRYETESIIIQRVSLAILILIFLFLVIAKR